MTLEITGQLDAPTLRAIEAWVAVPIGTGWKPATIAGVQLKSGTTPTGEFGPVSARNLERFLGLPAETIGGLYPGLTRGLQRYLNALGEPSVPTAPFVVSATAKADGTAKLVWTWPASVPVSSWIVSRDGTDTTGAGSWNTSVPGSTREHTFGNLAAGRSYTLRAVPVVTGAAGVTIPGTPPTTPPTTPPPTGGGTLSGLPWRSGGFGIHKAASLTEYAARRGAPLDIITVFPSRESWSAMQGTWYMDSQRIPAGFRGRLDVGVPLLPDDGSFAAAARGDYDVQWRQLAQSVHSRYPGSYIRLGWEFNLPQWKHAATPGNVGQWIESFRRAATAIRVGGLSLNIAWVPNKGPSQTGLATEKAWPGASFVDVVGIDAYDWWPAYTSDSAIAAHRDGEYGWNYWMAFAKAQGKTFCVPEWGLYPASSASGGDNPRYIEFVRNWLSANRDSIEYESYFQETAAYYKGDLHIGRNPLASAKDRELIARLRG